MSEEAKAFSRALDSKPRQCGHVMWACPCVEVLFDEHTKAMRARLALADRLAALVLEEAEGTADDGWIDRVFKAAAEYEAP
jgi:hypothetical protein